MKTIFCPALVFILVSTATSHDKPNIIIILADDLGWNDVGFHGSNQIPTPNIDALAYNGVVLNSHYVPALCTPSRTSLMTGKYPTSVGMQHLVILATEPWGLPLSETLMPEYFKRNGYMTHAIGKWHLGFFREEYTPTRRGFDSHYGYWNGYQDYYDHTMKDVEYKGYDMRRNMEVDWSDQGKYSTDLFTEEAVRIIEQHNSTQAPLFLYLAHLAPHAGNEDEPFQAPDEEISKFPHIQDPERRVYAAMVSKLDQSVGEVMAALRTKHMLDNSIVLFLSDNGAVTFGVHSNHGSNYPLRGLKESPWEGGVRGVAAIWSPLLNSTQRISNHLIHISDWLPTLYTAAGLDKTELGVIDGVDVWDSISYDSDESPRVEVLHNVDEIEGYSSFMMGDWKVIQGTAQGGEVDSWYGETGRSHDREYTVKDVLECKTSIAIHGYLTSQQLLHYNTDMTTAELLNNDKILRLRELSTISCTGTMSNSTFNPCDPLTETCLFNIKEDPCETTNLASSYPQVLNLILKRLRELQKGVVAPLNKDGDHLANPRYFNNVWTNWRDDNIIVQTQPNILFKFIILSSEELFLDINQLLFYSVTLFKYLYPVLSSLSFILFIVFLIILSTDSERVLNVKGSLKLLVTKLKCQIKDGS